MPTTTYPETRENETFYSARDLLDAARCVRFDFRSDEELEHHKPLLGAACIMYDNAAEAVDQSADVDDYLDNANDTLVERELHKRIDPYQYALLPEVFRLSVSELSK